MTVTESSPPGVVAKYAVSASTWIVTTESAADMAQRECPACRRCDQRDPFDGLPRLHETVRPGARRVALRLHV
jgi:hypothetical protein